MKILKILGLLLLVVLVIGAFQPTKRNYESSTTINAPKELIFSKVNNLKTWEEWGPWLKEDPTMKMTFTDKSEGVGANYSWTSDNSGNGKMAITETTPPTSMKADLEFEGQGGNESYFTLADAEGGGTKVTWGMDMKTPFPFNIMMLFMGGSMKKNMDQMYAAGLEGLKTMCEKEAAAAPAPAAGGNYEVKAMDFPAKQYLTVRTKLKIGQKEIEKFYTESLGKIMQYVQSKKYEMDGAPTGIFYSWDMATGITDMAAAIPVKNADAVGTGNIKLTKVEASKGFLIDYYGGYAGSAKAHEAMSAHIKTKGLMEKAPVIEEYITDPGTEPDSSKWLTKIVYFVK